MWTLFWARHPSKRWNKIYIEATRKEAENIFYNRWNVSPYNVSCRCCKSDYVAIEYETLLKATDMHRNPVFIKEKRKPSRAEEYRSLVKYLTREDILVIRSHKIGDNERIRNSHNRSHIR